jgi:uncharacterized Zn-binding protein involved in type VI secretion
LVVTAGQNVAVPAPAIAGLKHIVEAGGQLVCATGQAVVCGGHLVCVAGQAVFFSGHCVSTGGHLVVTAGQNVAAPTVPATVH